MAFDPEEIAEEFFESVRRVRALGAGTPETAYYPALARLFESVGAGLKPRVLCLSQLANTGAGSPDFGLFSKQQLQKGEPRPGQPPERGVVEVKSVSDDSLFTAEPTQLTNYLSAYGVVLVTNLRGFQIVSDSAAGPVRLEGFALADAPADFWALVADPKKSAGTVGRTFIEYLARALTQTVALTQPKDVAWFLASYARDALFRVERAGDLPALAVVRSALEDALGIRFEGDKGDHFFRSTLVQTLFYGVFSSWVIWARQEVRNPPHFDWRGAVWHLHVPFVAAIFQQLSSPQRLRPMGLEEVLDWTGETLNRVDAEQFLPRFDAGEAVQYFYEPFLKAFDPELQKQFGVWYTPTDVISYMVARVDLALKQELGIPDGLAADNVFVLDPCCGTGGFLKGVLARIRHNLQSHGLGDTIATRLRQAATSRLFGFEIMPAPFVVAHLQIGLALKNMGAPLADSERPSIYLTNALTGWEPHENHALPIPELEEERAAADAVKLNRPILVILGNPPYDGFAGVASNDEERGLSIAYKPVKKVAPPKGQGLNELYVRFFRMAERRIVERSGQGIVAYISNYSWLDGSSFTGMRERFLDVFDSITIDSLNGDRFNNGKTTPAGDPDPSIFSTQSNPAGIQVGTSISLLIRKEDHSPSETIQFRDLWGTDKRDQLMASAEAPPASLYETVSPKLVLRLPFKPVEVSDAYVEWPLLNELLPVGFPGVKTSRDEFLVAIEKADLEQRVGRYFDKKVTDAEFAEDWPHLMKKGGGYDPPAVRAQLQARGRSEESDAKAAASHEPNPPADAIVPYAYRPFDTRWLFWERDTKLLDRNRTELVPHCLPGAVMIEAREMEAGREFSRGTIVSCLGDNFGNGLSTFFPAFLNDGHGELKRPNLQRSLEKWLEARGLSRDVIFYHVAATLHSPAYRAANGGALRLDWPRVPLPDNVDALEASAKLGRQVASLLDVGSEAHGVSTGSLLPGLSMIAISKGSDYAIRAGWGYAQTDEDGVSKVMPGPGRVEVRAWTSAETNALAELATRHGLDSSTLQSFIGYSAVDVYLNDSTSWSGIPERVWEYTLGGHQVLKKWLSYREASVLGRNLVGDEVMHFARSARRIAEVLSLGSALDAAHQNAVASAIPLASVLPE